MARTENTKEMQKKFLEIFSQCGVVAEAARVSGIWRRKLYEMRDEDPDFAELWDEAKENFVDKLEQEMFRRAQGWEEDRIGPDGTPYKMQKSSDTLLIFALKGKRPHIYGDKIKNEHSFESAPVPVILEDNGRDD